MVRAKFICSNVETNNLSGTPVEQVNFSAAVDGPENKEWSEWTPSGNLNMAISNPSAQGKFEQGKSYYLDFTPAD